MHWESVFPGPVLGPFPAVEAQQGPVLWIFILFGLCCSPEGQVATYLLTKLSQRVKTADPS